MKKTLFVGTVLLCSLLLFSMSCDSGGEDFGNASITVHNKSDYDVTDLLVGWEGIGGTGKEFPRLAELKRGESRTFPVVFFVAHANIRAGVEYSLNERRFNDKDEEGVIVDENTAIFPSREIVNGSELSIHITNENYTLSGGVPRVYPRSIPHK